MGTESSASVGTESFDPDPSRASLLQMGQLGMGDNLSYNQPTEVKGLKGKTVASAACGKNHTVDLRLPLSLRVMRPAYCRLHFPTFLLRSRVARCPGAHSLDPMPVSMGIVD